MKEKIIATVKEFLMEKINPDFIILFGSHVTGNTHAGSDVDVAFYKEDHGLNSYDLFILAGELASLLKVEKVDLIDLEEATTVFKAVILSTGEAIHVKDERFLNEYEMRAFSMYLKLNEDRQVILKEIFESGKVYGD